MSFSPTIKKHLDLVSPYVQIPDNINTFDFDTLNIDETFILKNITGFIFKQYIALSKIIIPEDFLIKFIALICDNYKENHFHNFQHAVNVLQMTYNLILTSKIIYKLKPIIVFACLIASISHDVDHPGNTNSYEVNSLSKRAIIYNDNSVLENYHCTRTFELLENVGLLKYFKECDLRDFRKTIIQCILGTDMSKHNEFINKFQTFNFNNESFTNEEQYFIVSSFLHCADLSNSIKDFDTSFEWSKRISLEFYEQTIKEELEGLPSLPFMKVYDNLSMCLNEISFIVNITIPMWDLVKSKFPHLSFLLDKCKHTLDCWKEIESRYISENDINNLIY
jgi:high affinity cGMP-specific 3',5'-cyclic phosphodiesterase 9